MKYFIAIQHNGRTMWYATNMSHARSWFNIHGSTRVSKVDIYRMFTLQKMISEVSEPRFWEAHGWSDGVVCELVETCGDVRGFVKDSFVVRTVEAAASGKK